MLLNLNVNAKKSSLVNVATTVLRVRYFGYDFINQELSFSLDFGDGTSPFVPQTSAILIVRPGTVFDQWVALNASPMSTGIPENIRLLMETLNASPSLIDGEIVTLDWTG